MGMSIDKAILRVQHSSMSVDDKETADFIINTMRKYQKIQEIYQKWNEVNDFAYNQAMQEIGKVLESEEIPND